MRTVNYSEFKFSGKSAEDYLIEAFKLIDRLPHNMQIVLDTSSKDAINGYGWHRIYHIAVYVIGKRCKKCGESTFDKHTFSDYQVYHHHEWKNDERLAFSCSFSDIGTDAEFERFKEFVGREGGTI